MIIHLGCPIGDTLGLTASLPELHKIYGDIEIYSRFPEIFINNPFVGKSKDFNIVSLQPCDAYSCNITKHYAKQLGVQVTEHFSPKIYLTQDEIEIAKSRLQNIPNKKVAVCLFSSADCRDIRYDYIKDYLKHTRNLGYDLLFFGTKEPDDTENIFTEVFVGQYGVSLRTVFSLINECDFYIGVDTGLFHVAAALNIPQIVFFRNNGCENNAYHNTYFRKSNKICGEECRVSCLAYCSEQPRCMDDFDMDGYLDILEKVIQLSSM